MYHLVVSELSVERFSWTFLSWNQRTFRISKIQNVAVAVWLYWCYTIWYYIFIFYIRRFLKHSSHFSSIEVTPLFLDDGLWNSLERVWGGSVQRVALWWMCVCVCFGIIWVAVKELKALLF